LVKFKLTSGRYHTGFNVPLWFRHTKDDGKGKHKAGDLVCTTFSTVEIGLGSEVYAKKTKWDNIPLALSNGSDPDNTEKGLKKGVRKLDADFLTGIRQRMLIILKALKFKRVFTFGRNNAAFFVPWLKPQVADSTLFYTNCDHMCQFYNPIYKPTKEAYLKLDIWLSIISSPLITYGREMLEKNGPGYTQILLIQRQAKSDGGKIGGKIGGKKAVERFALKNNAGKVLALFKCSGCAELKERPIDTPTRHRPRGENGKLYECGKWILVEE
jgi:hypothetical protein